MKRTLLRILTPLFNWLTEPTGPQKAPEISQASSTDAREQNMKKHVIEEKVSCVRGRTQKAVWECLFDVKYQTADDVFARLTRSGEKSISHSAVSTALSHMFVRKEPIVERVKRKGLSPSGRRNVEYAYRRREGAEMERVVKYTTKFGERRSRLQNILLSVIPPSGCTVAQAYELALRDPNLKDLSRVSIGILLLELFRAGALKREYYEDAENAGSHAYFYFKPENTTEDKQ